MPLRLLDPLLSLVFPRSCVCCSDPVERTADGPACLDCWNSTNIFSNETAVCFKCGLPLLLTAAQGTSDCGRCRNDRYDLARSAGAYEKAIAATIVEMKAQPAVPRSAARMLVGTAGLMGLHSTTLVIPVPLSKRRLAERGFNQAELLGRTVAEGLSLEMDTRTLGRDRHTHTHRAAMDRKAREASVKGAFIVRRPKLISGRDILLVDDVMTSGSTASECARVLKKAGAGEVKVLTLARALFSI